jgi:hypothetical protein
MSSIFQSDDTNSTKSVKSVNSIDSISKSNKSNESNKSVKSVNSPIELNMRAMRVVMSIYDIEKTIPDNSYNKPNYIYGFFYTENRWRYFKINNNIYIEISIKNLNEERKYMSSNGEWITYKIDPLLDKFILKEKYYYSN